MRAVLQSCPCTKEAFERIYAGARDKSPEALAAEGARLQSGLLFCTMCGLPAALHRGADDDAPNVYSQGKWLFFTLLICFAFMFMCYITHGYARSPQEPLIFLCPERSLVPASSTSSDRLSLDLATLCLCPDAFELILPPVDVSLTHFRPPRHRR